MAAAQSASSHAVSGVDVCACDRVVDTLARNSAAWRQIMHLFKERAWLPLCGFSYILTFSSSSLIFSSLCWGSTLRLDRQEESPVKTISVIIIIIIIIVIVITNDC